MQILAFKIDIMQLHGLDCEEPLDTSSLEEIITEAFNNKEEYQFKALGVGFGENEQDSQSGIMKNKKKKLRRKRMRRKRIQITTYKLDPNSRRRKYSTFRCLGRCSQAELNLAKDRFEDRVARIETAVSNLEALSSKIEALIQSLKSSSSPCLAFSLPPRNHYISIHSFKRKKHLPERSSRLASLLTRELPEGPLLQLAEFVNQNEYRR